MSTRWLVLILATILIPSLAPLASATGSMEGSCTITDALVHDTCRFSCVEGGSVHVAADGIYYYASAVCSYPALAFCASVIGTCSDRAEFPASGGSGTCEFYGALARSVTCWSD